MTIQTLLPIALNASLFLVVFAIGLRASGGGRNLLVSQPEQTRPCAPRHERADAAIRGHPRMDL
jgi:hypothetical protein